MAIFRATNLRNCACREVDQSKSIHFRKPVYLFTGRGSFLTANDNLFSFHYIYTIRIVVMATVRAGEMFVNYRVSKNDLEK